MGRKRRAWQFERLSLHGESDLYFLASAGLAAWLCPTPIMDARRHYGWQAADAGVIGICLDKHSAKSARGSQRFRVSATTLWLLPCLGQRVMSFSTWRYRNFPTAHSRPIECVVNNCPWKAALILRECSREILPPSKYRNARCRSVTGRVPVWP